MVSWNWNESQSEDGVVHQSTTNTDHNDASELKQGYDYANFNEIEPTPIGCWPLHEDSGSTAYDISGTNDGTYNGPTLGQEGILNTSSASFDGTDDYVNVGNTFSVANSSFSVSMWVYPRSVSGFRPVAKRKNASGGGFLMYWNDGQSDFVWWVDGDLVDTKSLTTDEWNHFVGVYDNSDGSLIFYRNGNEVNSGTSSGLSTDDGEFEIGRDAGYANADALIGDVRIYDIALTQSEIQTLYDVVASQGSWTSNVKTV